jgi:hypothetical protein
MNTIELNNNNTNINSLSDHLFWDIDKSKLDTIKSKKTIIQRVLDYGLMDDWKGYLLISTYSGK